ncbi:class II fructose-bisphosphate aldolase [Egicoccus sp. AB-alg6-2]|uniref:class II fructose-bisphosphate aldolase n=1 Tax=Egicoccus sp. AB-alg6-2 TaxID=3242692 RepID=UPI00359E5162
MTPRQLPPPPGASTLGELLPAAQRAGYAVPAFSPRYLACVQPVIEAAVELRAPFIVEISQRELGWFALTPAAFRDEVDRVVRDLAVDVPYALHLDHTWEEDRIRQAMDAGFTSVMFDASQQPYDENATRSRAVVEEAHARGVSVETELGKLTTTALMATEGGPDSYTDPDEAARFVETTGCDALAISVGTAHGAYPPSGATIDFARLAAIRAAVGDVPLVLHGGSGLPAAMVQQAIELPGGGISKMNIATDFEEALLAAVGGERRTSAELAALPDEVLAQGRAAVKQVARDKIRLLLAGGHG